MLAGSRRSPRRLLQLPSLHLFGTEADVLALAAQFGREFSRDDASGAEQNVFRFFSCHQAFARREDYSRKGRLAVIDSTCRILSLRRHTRPIW
jgi:hypothetical protein